MSPFLLQIFVFMLVTFVLGFAIAWLIWKFDSESARSPDAVNSEIDFWRSSLEQSRMERDKEQQVTASLHEEKNILKRRIKSLEEQLKAKAKP